MKPWIRQELEYLRAKNPSYSSGRILGSMCTQPHPAAVEAFAQFIETNLGDTELFPGTSELEQRLINQLGDLLTAPSGSERFT